SRDGETCSDPGPGPALAATYKTDSVLHLRDGLPGIVDDILDVTEDARYLINGQVDLDLPSAVEFIIGGFVAGIIRQYVPSYAIDILASRHRANQISVFHASDDVRATTYERRRTSDDVRATTCERRRASDDVRATTCERHRLSYALVFASLFTVAGAGWWLSRDTAPAPTPIVINEPQTTPQPLAQIPDAGPADATMAPLTLADAQPAPVRRHRVPTVPESSKPTGPQKPPSSTLPAQLELLDRARQQAKLGKHAAALRVLADFTKLYPRSPLGAEVELTRAESLSRSGRHTAAIAQVQRLLQSPAHRGRRGQLSQMLGDLWLQRGKCELARPAYERALAFGLSEQRAKGVRRALARCKPEEATENK
ncbi:MAG: tetratricopeptide repeat protein, partial [Myxococcales bacterium]|nr:tetratricopeptide repeat protein [Myxococcales bacterium]